MTHGEMQMKGLRIVGLGAVTEETHGTMIRGNPDPGGFHYFLFTDSTATDPRREFEEEPDTNTGFERVSDAKVSGR
jgi:hypothetical protein